MRRRYLAWSCLAAFALASLLTIKIHGQSAPGVTITQNVIFESFAPASSRTSKRLSAVSANGDFALLERDNDRYPDVPGFHYRLLRMADGRKMDVFDPIQVKTTIYEPQTQAVHVQKLQANQCAGKMDHVEGLESLLGFQTVKLTQVAKDREFTRWLAPAFGCAELQKIAIWKDPATGMIRGKTSYLPESVKVGDPAPEIFSVPAYYQEKSPSEAAADRSSFQR